MNKDKTQVKAALEGIRVIELGVQQLVPLAARCLAEAGAEVIKIEGLPGGDPVRGVQVLVARGRSNDTRNWSLEYFNWGKKSVGIHLGHEQARQLIYRLVERSDVFISNYRLPALERWGLGYKSLAGVNKRIVYGHGSGFGTRGPDSGRAALDMVGQARSGLLGISGDPDGISMIPGLTPCDKVAALQLAHGIVLALFARERTGVGQMVGSSLLSGGLYLTATELQYCIGTKMAPPALYRKSVANPLRNFYETKDGRWIAFNMTQGDRYWPEFCKALGIEHLQHQPNFVSMAARAEHREEVISMLEQVFASKNKDEWEQVLSRHDLVWATINTLPEVAADPQVLDNGYVQDYVHPQVGEVKVIGPLVELSETPLRIGEQAPELGQHTEEVLLEVGGYTWEDLARFKEDGVII